MIVQLSVVSLVNSDLNCFLQLFIGYQQSYPFGYGLLSRTKPAGVDQRLNGRPLILW